MRKTILTYNDIHEANQLLQSNDLHFKIHLHDTCGAQSFSIEPLNAISDESQYEEMKKCICEYFRKKEITIAFYENNMGFSIVK